MEIVGAIDNTSGNLHKIRDNKLKNTTIWILERRLVRHEFERNARTAEADSPREQLQELNRQSRRKRRVVAMVKTASDKGFYVDIFRSNQMDNDYLFHNVGTSLNLMDAGGKLLPLTETERLEKIYGEGYNWF